MTCQIDSFSGDFEWLPIAAHFRYGQVPQFPTSDEFQSACVRVSGDLDRYAEAHWFLEAVRERRMNPGRTMDEDALHDISERVAQRLYRRAIDAA